MNKLPRTLKDAIVLVWDGFYLVSAVDEIFKPVHVSYLKVVSLNLTQI